MPDLQPHQRLGASRRSVDRAGDLLRDWRRSGSVLLSPDEQEAESLVERYRHEFEVPLTKVVMGLRSFLATEDLAVEVGQRLKRRPRIIEKLVRHGTMHLTSMQDVAGARALLPDVAAVDRIRDRIDRARWDVVSVDDYNVDPKSSGYRALHLVVRRDATLVEIQLRTEWQQEWAPRSSVSTLVTASPSRTRTDRRCSSDTCSEWLMLSMSGTGTSRSSVSSRMNSRCWNGRPHGG